MKGMKITSGIVMEVCVMRGYEDKLKRSYSRIDNEPTGDEEHLHSPSLGRDDEVDQLNSTRINAQLHFGYIGPTIVDSIGRRRHDRDHGKRWCGFVSPTSTMSTRRH